MIIPCLKLFRQHLIYAKSMFQVSRLGTCFWIFHYVSTRCKFAYWVILNTSTSSFCIWNDFFYKNVANVQFFYLNSLTKCFYYQLARFGCRFFPFKLPEIIIFMFKTRRKKCCDSYTKSVSILGYNYGRCPTLQCDVIRLSISIITYAGAIFCQTYIL